MKLSIYCVLNNNDDHLPVHDSSLSTHPIPFVSFQVAARKRLEEVLLLFPFFLYLNMFLSLNLSECLKLGKNYEKLRSYSLCTEARDDVCWWLCNNFQAGNPS